MIKLQNLCFCSLSVGGSCGLQIAGHLSRRTQRLRSVSDTFLCQAWQRGSASPSNWRLPRDSQKDSTVISSAASTSEDSG